MTMTDQADYLPPVASTIDLSSISLSSATDALLTDYFHKLRTLSRAYGRKGKGKELDDLTEEALERRSLVNMMEGRLLEEDDIEQEEKGDGTQNRALNGNIHGGHIPGCHHVQELWDLSPSETQRWKDWIPGIGQQVLVYLSSERGSWPGQIIPLSYFSSQTLPSSIPPENLFAVRIYPSKQAPTLTLKSHMIPLHYRPSPPTTSSPTLFRAYEVSSSPFVYATEATALEIKMRNNWGMNPLRVDDDGRPWRERLSWLEKEGKQEIGMKIGGGMSVEEREKVMLEAETILHKILGDGKRAESGLRDQASSDVNGHSEARPSTTSGLGHAMQLDNNPVENEKPTYGRTTYRRSRRNFNSMLADPLIGPVLERMDLTMLQDALIMPKLNPSTMANGGIGVPQDFGPFTYVSTGAGALAGKRKRGMDTGELSDIGEDVAEEDRGRGDFVSPLNGKMMVEAQLREDDEMDMDGGPDSGVAGWQIYSRKKRRKSG